MSNRSEAYTDFASVYDTFMDETPYQTWKQLIIEWIHQYGISEQNKEQCEALECEKNLILDLGCGTGTLTELLALEGFDMIGIDCSSDMLEIAMQKKQVNHSSVLYLQQDMVELDLYSTVGTVISICDSINYILEPSDLLTVFQNVNKFLYPNGIFIFDFNTVYKYKEIIGNQTIAENREECAFIWENYYDEALKMNEYEVAIFVQEEDYYRKFVETHYQRGYEVEEIKTLLLQAGLELILMIDADTKEQCTKKSERVYVVARECMKEK